jgi:NADH-quinone oxidoreductase subunit F
MERLVEGKGASADIDLLLDLCDNILGRAFCALGDGATSPVNSAIQYFRDEFEAGTHTPADALFPPERSSLFTYTPRRGAGQLAGAHA